MELLALVPHKELAMVLRLCLAAVLGGVIGIERGSGDRPAGLRTHILVCVGSALFMLVSMYGFDEFSDPGVLIGHDPGQRRDSARIAAQVVSGIGFLGAGTILHEGLTIRGLTTAASLWIASAIGLAAGSGMYFISILATCITLITLVFFHSWEKRLAAAKNNDKRFIRVITANRTGAITDVTGFLSLNGVNIKSLNVKNNKEKQQLTIELYIKLTSDAPEPSVLVREMREIEGVISVERFKA